MVVQHILPALELIHNCFDAGSEVSFSMRLLARVMGRKSSQKLADSEQVFFNGTHFNRTTLDCRTSSQMHSVEG
jgi:hypothetical protein